MKPVVIAILGPTAVGKTAVSIHLAQQLGAEIVSVDSCLFYRGLDIGTAKPTVQERGDIPHHMIDIADPSDTYSLAKFQQEAMQVIAEIHQRGRYVLLVGGTGQYMTALLEGWTPPPTPPDNSIRLRLQREADQNGKEAIYQRLKLLDPEMAAIIDLRNVRRVIRALEIYELTGKKPSSLRGANPPAYEIYRVGLKLPRSENYARVDERIHAMLRLGWVQEVQGLLDQGVSVQASAFSAIGYRQIAAYLHNEMTLEEAVAEIMRITRIFIRRQANWFKKDDPRIHWFDAVAGVEQEVLAYLRTQLSV